MTGREPAQIGACRSAVIDGGGIACLGLRLRDAGRQADLRRPLCVALLVARSGAPFRCYVDANLPYRIRQEDRALLDLLAAEHPDEFPAVPPRADPTDYVLQRAASDGSAAVGPEGGIDAPEYAAAYPWLAAPGRLLAVGDDGEGALVAGGLSLPYFSLDPFALYDELFPHLS